MTSGSVDKNITARESAAPGVAVTGSDEELVAAGPMVIDVDGESDFAVLAHLGRASDLGVVTGNEETPLHFRQVNAPTEW